MASKRPHQTLIAQKSKVAPHHLYTPQTQNGATPTLYYTNPERRHTTSIHHKPRTAPHDRYTPCARAEFFTTLRARASIFNTPSVCEYNPCNAELRPQGANLCLNLLNSLYSLKSINSLESFNSLNSLNSLDSLNLCNSRNLIHLIHFQFTYRTEFC